MKKTNHLLIIFLLITTIVTQSHATEPTGQESKALLEECQKSTSGPCHSKTGSLKLKLIAIVAILVTSMMSVTLPLVSRSVPALHLDTKLFVLVKVFASGVILATGYMHSMMSAVGTLMIDSYMMSGFKKYSRNNNVIKNPDPEMKIMGHCHGDVTSKVDDCASQLRRYRVVAQVPY
ncbi:hypothetical protein Tco_0644359 [Tanacetum coccineum]